MRRRLPLVAYGFGRQKLECDQTAQLGVFGLVDVAHDTFANLADNAIVEEPVPNLKSAHGDLSELNRLKFVADADDIAN